MNSKLSLATATAIGLALGAAHAGSNNKTYLDQDGAANAAAITQSGNNNQFGNTGTFTRAFQDGSYNDIVATQSGNGNKAGVGGSAGIDQKGNRNLLTIDQSGDGNTIVDSGQYGISSGGDGAPVNSADVTQSSDSNTITKISQRSRSGSAVNAITAVQEGGNGNTIAGSTRKATTTPCPPLRTAPQTASGASSRACSRTRSSSAPSIASARSRP